MSDYNHFNEGHNHPFPSDEPIIKKFRLSYLFNNLFLTFSVQIIVLTIAVYWFAKTPLAQELDPESPGILELGMQGLSFVTLTQLFFNSLGCSILSSLFLTTLVFKKMLTLWRSILLLISLVLFTSGMAFWFDWFGRSLEGWLSFYCSSGIFFLGFVLIISIKMHFKNRQYQTMLQEYKKKNSRKDEKYD